MVMKNQSDEMAFENAAVSVIIPCYRCADTIQRAVDSVIAQTLPPEEIILIDDFSNDGGVVSGALDQLRLIYPRANIKIIQLDKNCGPGSARNAGWNVSSQPYLAFLDADDSWHPKKLEIHYQWMLAHPQVVLSGHPSVKISIGTRLPVFPARLLARRVNRCSLMFSNCFPARSVMLKREVPYRFIPEKRYAEDYMLWLTIVFAGHPAYLLNLPMAYSYKDEFGEGGLTGNLWKAQAGVMSTFQRLHKAGLISTPILILISSFSMMKFFRRWGVVKWRTLFRSEMP